MISAFTDGGCVGRNPSKLGGTWAWVVVDADDKEVARASGVITPEQWGMPEVTNNATELLAALKLMEYLPNGWAGTLFTDSQITLFRITRENSKFNGIPDAIEADVKFHRRRLGDFKVVLLDGHPTKAQLDTGIGKRGHGCSRWNVLCDVLCNQEAEKWRSQQ